jgi:hypothetical protein
MYLYDTSFLTINSLVSMSVPGVVQLMQGVFLNFVYFDLFYTEKWLPLIIPEAALSDDEEGLNVYFEENGFGTTFFMVNIGSTLVFVVFHIALFALYPLLSVMAKHAPL